MIRFSLCLAAAMAILLPAPSVMAQSAGVTLALGNYPNVKSASEIIQKWSPDQHLYVKGNMGINADQLNRLEAWLDQNAPHWTVVLMNNANGETYTSLDRRSFQGMDAVEYALGRGLALRTNFSDWIDERTGETDGAVSVMFLTERKFSYYASVAQDVRSLGESHWIGELDRPAFRAMRGGGRVLDAVKDTITNINSRLTQKISAEKEQAERERRSRQRAYANLKTDIEALRQSIAMADQKAASIKAALPDATGELTAPPTEQWRRQLDEVDGMLTADNVAKTTGEYHNVAHEVEGFLNSFAEHDTFDTTIKPIEENIDALMNDELGRRKAARETGNQPSGRSPRDAHEGRTRDRPAHRQSTRRCFARPGKQSLPNRPDLSAKPRERT